MCTHEEQFFTHKCKITFSFRGEWGFFISPNVKHCFWFRFSGSCSGVSSTYIVDFYHFSSAAMSSREWFGAHTRHLICLDQDTQQNEEINNKFKSFAHKQTFFAAIPFFVARDENADTCTETFVYAPTMKRKQR